MKKHSMHLKDLSPTKDWTLFLDRDGVINERLIGDYVKTPDEFVFIRGVPEAIARLSKLFGRIFVVTNQQGIGKGLMTDEDLRIIHEMMIRGIEDAGGFITKIYHCPDLKKHNSHFRKPNTGMAKQAQIDFPELDFDKSVMVGDSPVDMEFGRKLGMARVYISNENGLTDPESHDFIFDSLPAFANHIIERY